MLNYTHKDRNNLLQYADEHPIEAVEKRREANAINLDLDTPIYRICSLDRFMGLLHSGENVLVRTSMWDDPFENVLLNHEYRASNGKIVDMSCIRDSWYGQCWTLKEHECDGLWRVYTKNGAQRSVRIKSTVRKVFEPLYDGSKEKEWQFFIGKVDYSSESDIMSVIENIAAPLASDPTNVCQMQMLLTKRKEFEYEQEVRLLYCKGVDHNNHETIYRYSIDANGIYEEVILDPWCPDNMVKNYADDIYREGFHGNVSKSSLYSPVHVTTQLV